MIREYCEDNYLYAPDNTRELIYLYDESGVIGLLYSLNGSTPTPYYYHKNIQGDVIAIYDTNGNIQAEYAYDAFGKCTIKNSTFSDLARYNPIRYRGYYLDRETGLYYLNSRYYNPDWRRFISPDDTAYIDPQTPNGLNLYCYCGNEPVNIKNSSIVLNRWCVFARSGLITSSISYSKNNYNRWNGLLNIPEWIDLLSTGLDYGFSVVNPVRSAIACLQFTNLWDLMRLDGVTELPGMLSKVATGIGLGLSIVGGMITGYEKYTSGASLSSSITGGVISAGISVGGMYASTAIANLAMGTLAASSLAVPGAVIIVGGAMIAVGAGIAINHMATKIMIGGNTIEGYLNDFADWIVFWN